VSRLDELDETIGGVERELHAESLGEHTFACNNPACKHSEGRTV
jgi:hypothetical protein